MELLVPMVFKHISGIRGEWIFCGEEMCSLAHTWKMVFTAAPGRAPAASRLCEEAHGSGPSCGGGGGGVSSIGRSCVEQLARGGPPFHREALSSCQVRGLASTPAGVGHGPS